MNEPPFRSKRKCRSTVCMGNFGKRLKDVFGRRPAAAPKGFTLISDLDPQDIFIAGYPKSGNSWFQELIAGVVYGVMPEFSLPALVHELVPDVHFKAFYQRFNTPMFFKTHSLPRPEYKRVVYLLRDGRDAMVSYFHHSSAVGRKPPSLLRMVQDGPELGPCHPARPRCQPRHPLFARPSFSASVARRAGFGDGAAAGGDPAAGDSGGCGGSSVGGIGGGVAMVEERA